MSAPIGPRESARLQKLRQLEILDTAPDEAYQRIVRLVAEVFHTPIALVSLVEEDRQWFKAKHGLEVCETPRDLSFCAHAILSDDVLVVYDAQEDPRFSENLLVTGPPYIRFYAGAPIVTQDGHALGSLCVIDTQPRVVTPTMTAALRHLAAHLACLIELRRFQAHLARCEQATERAWQTALVACLKAI